MIISLKEGERLDDLHRSNYKIIQNPCYFSFGMDAVLLASFADIHKNEKHLDICCGNGVVPILLAARHPAASFCGIEIQQELAEMAMRSVAFNGLENKISIVNGDLKNAANFFPASSFDAMTANPPYAAPGSGLENISKEMAIARHEIACTLDDVCACASKMLRFGGRFYMVHRPTRLADIIVAMRKNNLEPKTLRFVQPRTDAPPNTMLIMAAKGGKPQLNIQPPLVVYGADGKYTPEVKGIYYD